MSDNAAKTQTATVVDMEAQKRELLAQLMALGVDTGEIVKAAQEQKEIQEREFKDAITATILKGNKKTLETIKEKGFTTVILKFVEEREYTNDDGSTGKHPEHWELTYHKKETKTILPPSGPGAKIPPLLKNSEGKTYSGRGIIPTWVIAGLKADKEFSSYSDSDLTKIISSNFKDHSITQDVHDSAWKLLKAKYPV